MEENFYLIVGENVANGFEPTVMVSEGNSPFEHLLFRTECDAQLEIADRMITKLGEFAEGERDFEDAITIDEHVIAVIRRGDGKIFPKDYGMPLSFGGW